MDDEQNSSCSHRIAAVACSVDGLGVGLYSLGCTVPPCRGQATPRRDPASTPFIKTQAFLLDRPLRGAALTALKALPADPEYNAYRAAGIPDNAVPRELAPTR